MPSYNLRQHDNGIHYIHWTDGRRSRRVSTGKKEASQAQTFLAHWILSEQEDRAAGGPTLLISELWDLYFARHVEKNNVDTRPAETVWKNLGPHFGQLRPADVERKDAIGLDAVDQYIAARQVGKIGRCPAAPATIRHELSILKACFNWCAKPKQKFLRPADVPVFDLPPNSDPRDRWLRADEMQKMITSAAALRDGDRLSRGERFVWLALETAARLMAILELTWDRVDFETGVIHYNVPGRRKTKKRRVSVPMSKALRPVLERAYRERVGDLVCDGLSLSIWRRVASIAKHADVADVSPHVLRHTAATQMLRRGVSMWIVAGILGNTVSVCEKIYGHHVPDGLAGGVELISGGLLAAAE